MLKLIAKPILWLVTCAVPVFISACYGSGYQGGEQSETLEGTVKNLSGQGIPNIQITCDSGFSTGHDQTFSQNDGSFSIQSYEDTPCQTLRFEDVDGAENGTYLPQAVPVNDEVDFAVVLQDRTE